MEVGEAGYGAGGVTVICGAGIAGLCFIEPFVESCEDFGGLGGWHVEETAPYFRGGEAAGCEARNDAKVVGTAFEGAPEVGIDSCGRCGDGAGGEDDFVAEDVGAH